MRWTLAILVCLLALAPAAQARAPWPPPGGAGDLFVHYGEEHWNDEDGLTLLPKVVSDSIKFRPDMVTMSGDKGNDGNVAELTKWREIVSPYDRAGIPYFAGVGNHDGKQATPEFLTGIAGGATPLRDISFYKDVFAGRPYPYGDARPYRDPDISPRTRPASDPAGASTHYWVDHGRTRFIFIDNSCYGIINCDPFQNPRFPDAEGNRNQYEFMARHTRAAKAAGKLVFVVMHMPTRDPRDQEHSTAARENHVMGKGSSPDNTEFERRAESLGIDGVLLGHIKGQWLYRGRGNIPYWIDGGAGGELYTDGPEGVDHGYWHGFRLLRVRNGRFRTDVVPIFIRNSIRIAGSGVLRPAQVLRFTARGRQPVFNHDKGKEPLELRDPEPIHRNGLTFAGVLPFLPLLLLVLGGLAIRPRRLSVVLGSAVVVFAAVAGVSVAQQGVPTATERQNLPNPARIWTSANPNVLAPVASSSEDPRRDPGKQTHDGLFRARCPGTTRVVIQSGTESSDRNVRVLSRAGRIARRARVRHAALRPGRKRPVARVRLAQPAEVIVRVKRRGRVLRTLRSGCFRANRRLTFFWDGRLRRRGRGRLRIARTQGYRIEVLIRSDRRGIRRTRVVSLLRPRG